MNTCDDPIALLTDLLDDIDTLRVVKISRNEGTYSQIFSSFFVSDTWYVLIGTAKHTYMFHLLCKPEAKDYQILFDVETLSSEWDVLPSPNSPYTIDAYGMKRINIMSPHLIDQAKNIITQIFYAIEDKIKTNLPSELYERL